MPKETIEVMKDIYSENYKIAEDIRRQFSNKKIFTINILGAPGAGKTSLLIQIIKRLKQPAAVIEGDVESDFDTQTLQEIGIPAYQINTFGGCHLDSPMISKALESFPLVDNSFLFIENIGNLICPAEFDIGEHCRLVICSTSDGSDKPYKYPLAFERASAVIVNKSDLLPYVDFNKEFFIKGVKNLNENAEIFYVSCKKEDGIEKLIDWLNQKKKNLEAE